MQELAKQEAICQVDWMLLEAAVSRKSSPIWPLSLGTMNSSETGLDEQDHSFPHYIFGHDLPPGESR